MIFNWFDEGSILILLPDSIQNMWCGIDTDDYNLACDSSEDWLSTIAVAASEGLLLGGDSGMTLFTSNNQNQVILVRWIYADDEQKLIDFALSGKSISDTEPDIEVINESTKWRLFNAAENGSKDNLNTREVTLPLGRLTIKTTYQENETNAVIVHTFTASG